MNHWLRQKSIVPIAFWWRVHQCKRWKFLMKFTWGRKCQSINRFDFNWEKIASWKEFTVNSNAPHNISSQAILCNSLRFSSNLPVNECTASAVPGLNNRSGRNWLNLSHWFETSVRSSNCNLPIRFMRFEQFINIQFMLENYIFPERLLIQLLCCSAVAQSITHFRCEWRIELVTRNAPADRALCCCPTIRIAQVRKFEDEISMEIPIWITIQWENHVRNAMPLFDGSVESLGNSLRRIGSATTETNW